VAAALADLDILGVERMIVRLGALYLPGQERRLRAAALLHDVTKEESTQNQLQILHDAGIITTDYDRQAPKTLHARTAALRIPVEFPEFADETVLSMVRYHTTGRRGMTLPERLLYLADYIDETRTFPDCVLLRQYFFDAQPDEMSMQERLALLGDTMILSYDLTIRGLLDEQAPVCADTVEARNEELLLAAARKADA
jgi:nicotinate-nucleotide adenylyltransferase